MSSFIDKYVRRRARAFREIGAAFEVQRSELDHIKVQIAELKGTSEALLRELRSVEEISRLALAQIESIRREADASHASSIDSFARLRRILFDVRARTGENRERLFRLRETPEYARAYTEPNPLVSVLIPTYDRVDTLLGRALPSVLGQTHTNLEVLVLGDGSPPDVREAIATVGDPRVRYLHQTANGPYPEDQRDRWFVKGSPGINLGLLSARGSWVSFFADDDTLRDDAIETTLAAAREQRLEICYGKVRLHLSDGRVEDLGAFPPALGGQGLQGAVMHAGLRFLQHELGDGDLGIPNDWSLMYRALLLGAHVGMVDEVLADWYDVGTSPPSENTAN
jgi:hypothetical protein